MIDVAVFGQQVGLVLLDSVSCLFRHTIDDLALRTRIVTNIAQTLQRVAQTANVAVNSKYVLL